MFSLYNNFINFGIFYTPASNIIFTPSDIVTFYIT